MFSDLYAKALGAQAEVESSKPLFNCNAEIGTSPMTLALELGKNPKTQEIQEIRDKIRQEIETTKDRGNQFFMRQTIYNSILVLAQMNGVNPDQWLRSLCKTSKTSPLFGSLFAVCERNVLKTAAKEGERR